MLRSMTTAHHRRPALESIARTCCRIVALTNFVLNAARFSKAGHTRCRNETEGSQLLPAVHSGGSGTLEGSWHHKGAALTCQHACRTHTSHLAVSPPPDHRLHNSDRHPSSGILLPYAQTCRCALPEQTWRLISLGLNA